MTRRAAAAAAAANMATSLRARPSRGRHARDSSGDGGDDAEGGPSNDIKDDSDGDSSPRAQRRSTRVVLPRSSSKRKIESEDEDGDDDNDAQDSDARAAVANDGNEESDVGNSGAEGSQFRDPPKRGRGRPPKRGRGRPPKNRTIERLQREAADEEDTDGDGAGDETGNYSMTDAGDMTVDAGRAGDETPEGESMGLRDYVLNNDEYELDADPQGDTKIDSKGRLQDGREFLFHTFPSPYRPDPEVHYCLSIDAAKIGGYRDSFYFYRNNPLLIKVNCSDHEKDALIERGSLSGHLRNRVVTMVAVRNVFKLHGARIIKNGRAVIDDYYEELARKSGRKPGQLVDVNSDNAPVPTRLMERRQEVRREIRQRERETRKPETVARTSVIMDLQGPGADGTTTFGDTGESPFERAKTWNTRKQNSLRTEINETSWMMEMARMVRGMNAELLAGRTERLRGFPRPYLGLDHDDDSDDEKPEEAKTDSAKDKAPPIGIYEALTNVPHYPITTQPQAARLERVHDRPLVNGAAISNGASQSSSSSHLAVLGGAKVGPAAWGIASVEQRVQLPNAEPVRNVRVPAAHSAYEP